MPPRQVRFPWRASLLAATALGALERRRRGQRPARHARGREKLSAFFATYLGKPAAGDPATFAVTPEGSDYARRRSISAALMAPFKVGGPLL